MDICKREAVFVDIPSIIWFCSCAISAVLVIKSVITRLMSPFDLSRVALKKKKDIKSKGRVKTKVDFSTIVWVGGYGRGQNQ